MLRASTFGGVLFNCFTIRESSFNDLHVQHKHAALLVELHSSL